MESKTNQVLVKPLESFTDKEIFKLMEIIKKERILQHRANLSEIYPVVKICLRCKKEYGIDMEDAKALKREKGVCPICLMPNSRLRTKP